VGFGGGAHLEVSCAGLVVGSREMVDHADEVHAARTHSHHHCGWCSLRVFHYLIFDF
jgi:hypothetical protein